MRTSAESQGGVPTPESRRCRASILSVLFLLFFHLLLFRLFLHFLLFLRLLLLLLFPPWRRVALYLPSLMACWNFAVTAPTKSCVPSLRFLPSLSAFRPFPHRAQHPC